MISISSELQLQHQTQPIYFKRATRCQTFYLYIICMCVCVDLNVYVGVHLFAYICVCVCACGNCVLIGRPEDHCGCSDPVGEEAVGCDDSDRVLSQRLRSDWPAAVHGEPAE